MEQFDIFESLFFALSFCLFSITIILYLPFITLYTANMDLNYVYETFPVLFVISELIIVLRIPAIIAINSVGHFKEVKWYAIYESIIAIFTALIFVFYIGFIGVLMGVLFGAIYRTPILIRYINKYILERSTKVSILKLFYFMIPFVFACLISLSQFIKVQGFLQWIVLAMETSILFFFVYYIMLKIKNIDFFKYVYYKKKV